MSFIVFDSKKALNTRDGSRTAATSKMEHFVIIVNGLILLKVKLSN